MPSTGWKKPSPPRSATAPGVEQGWTWPDESVTWMLLKADVTKAHRRIKVSLPDWKYQVAQIQDSWWVSRVGTYGMASAQLYWGRMAALLLRLVYALFPMDDFCWILRASQSRSLTAGILATLLAVGTPRSWKKTTLSEVNTWLGFVINPVGPIVRMGQEKHDAIMKILSALRTGQVQVFSWKDLERILGKLNWATTVCPLTRPFVQLFWSWKMACTTSGRPGQLIRMLASLLESIFATPYIQPSPFAPSSSS